MTGSEAERAVDWASGRLRALPTLVEWISTQNLLRNRRVAIITHLEPKAAAFVCAVAGTGADIIVGGSNPSTTRLEVAEVLRSRGFSVQASGTEASNFESDMAVIGDQDLDIVLDDGAELTTRVMATHPGRRFQGVCEQTTTGLARLRQHERSLTFPVIAGNDAACKSMFDNRHAAGQGFVHAFMQVTNLTLMAKTVAVFGFGPVGRGIAEYSQRFGSRILVVEPDPIRALEAEMRSMRVVSKDEALEAAHVIVTATGEMGVIGTADAALMRDGAILCNMGHSAEEIEVDGLRTSATRFSAARDQITTFNFPNGRRVNLLADGAILNIVGAEGHPIEIMDLSFAVQLMGAVAIASGSFSPGIHQLPGALDTRIAESFMPRDLR